MKRWIFCACMIQFLLIGVVCAAPSQAPKAENSLNALPVGRVKALYLTGEVDSKSQDFVRNFLEHYAANDPKSLDKISDEAGIQVVITDKGGKSRRRVFSGKDYKSVARNDMLKAVSEKRFYRFYSVTIRVHPEGTGLQVVARRLSEKEKLITPFLMEVSETEGKGLQVSSIVLSERDDSPSELVAPAIPAAQPATVK